jgi:hypothetical protein
MPPVIWHYPIPFGERRFVLQLPLDTRIMGVEVVGGHPRIYACVADRELPKVEVVFHVLPTGVDLTGEEVHTTFIGTYQPGGGALVFHLAAFLPPGVHMMGQSS